MKKIYQSSFYTTLLRCLLLSLLLITSVHLIAQKQPKDKTKVKTKTKSQTKSKEEFIPETNTCGLYSPYQIDVDRIIRYPLEATSMPGGEVIDLELSLGNPTVNQITNNVFLQIAISSAKVPLKELSRPLNVAFVVDRSVSMLENNRIAKLRLALKEYVKIFDKNDILSIIVYDDSPLLLRPASKVSDINLIMQSIDSITLRGSTNIWAGMDMGYKEISKNLSSSYTNRLVLFTDGMSTVGITSPKDILSRSLTYNKKGIETSTFGLGAGINFELLTQLALQGGGLANFIGDCDSLLHDVKVKLADELENMMPIAKDMVLTINCPSNMQVEEVYGYQLENENESSVRIPVKNIGNGQKKIILTRLKVNSPPRQVGMDIDVNLAFYDNNLQQNTRIVRSARSLFVKKSNSRLNLLTDDEVRRTYTIAYMGDELKRSLLAFDGKRYTESLAIVDKCIAEVRDLNEFMDFKPFKLMYHLLVTQNFFLTGGKRK